MSVSVALSAFLAGALVSLVTSWLLVSRLERVGERLGLSEALLGLVAALAADAPEITAAVAAIAGRQQQIGAGVVIGSNVFNLAALLGLGAVAAGRISLHRRVVVLGGTVAAWVAGVCLAVVAGVMPPAAGLVLALGAMAVYAVVLGAGPHDLGRLPLPRAWIAWLRSAVAEEEMELESAIRPRPARRQDVAVAAAALLVVVAASVMMERAASLLGSRFAVPEIVVGGLVLAAVTSFPNAVAAVYLAARGRGAATLSTALNSNALNVVIGLLLPAALLGLGHPTSQTTLIAAWYAGLTLAMVAFAYRDSGIRRLNGAVIIAAYVVFAGSLLASAYAALGSSVVITAGAAAAIASGAGLLASRGTTGKPANEQPRSAGDSATALPGPLARASANGNGPASGPRREPARNQAQLRGRSLLPGWPVGRLLILGLTLTCVVAAVDAGLGHRTVLIGLLCIGPCCVLLTGRWVLTVLTGTWATALAVILGIPDGIWGTSTHLAFLAAVATVAIASTVAAAVTQAYGPQRLR